MPKQLKLTQKYKFRFSTIANFSKKTKNHVCNSITPKIQISCNVHLQAKHQRNHIHASNFLYPILVDYLGLLVFSLHNFFFFSSYHMLLDISQQVSSAKTLCGSRTSCFKSTTLSSSTTSTTNHIRPRTCTQNFFWCNLPFALFLGICFRYCQLMVACWALYTVSNTVTTYAQFCENADRCLQNIVDLQVQVSKLNATMVYILEQSQVFFFSVLLLNQ